MIVRDKCIFCGSSIIWDYFEEDLQAYVGHYQVDLSYPKEDMVEIPFNVSSCYNCKSAQLKYLGDPKEVYKHNHADSTGSIMHELHKKNVQFIWNSIDRIKNIIEIGSAKGVLADMIIELSKLYFVDVEYNIIEPCYFGNTDGKNIYNDFYENVDDSKINANTIVMSHIFEHFYEPVEILKKIEKNKNIENIFLVFPDLENYLDNGICHVLNTEHTFFISNDFLIDLFASFGFNCQRKLHYNGHSVLFEFTRGEKSNKPLVHEREPNLKLYFDGISHTVDIFNEAMINHNGEVYLWPSSIHSLYLEIFGFHFSEITGLLDNSPNKIGKKMYGTDCEVFSFNDITKKKDKSKLILVNGGIFNQEVESQLSNCKFIKA